MLIRLWIAGVLFFSWAPALFGQEPTLVVDGKPLVTSRPPTRIGNELFLPLSPIARALGADVVMGQDQTIKVRRVDGTVVVYDGRTGEIRAGAVMVGQVKDYPRVRVVGDLEQLLFPLSGVVAMFGVAARRDDDKNLLYLDSVANSGAAVLSQPGFSIADLNYSYGLTTNSSYFGQNLNVRGQAVAGTTHMTALVQATRVPNGPAVYLNQASVRADFSGSRALILGDQGIYTGIDALTNSMRGVGYEQKLKGFTAYLYGGKTIGSLSASFASRVPQYDTDLTGISLRRSTPKSLFAIGLNGFRNKNREGVTVGVAYGRQSALNQFNIQLAGGEFSGLSSHIVPVLSLPSETGLYPGTSAAVGNTLPAPAETTSPQLVISNFLPVHGPGYGATVSDAFSPVPQVSISGQWDYYSRNFLTARDDSRYNGASSGIASISVRPLRLLTLSGSASDRVFILGDSQRTRSYSFGTNLVVPGRHSPQLGFIRTTQLSASPVTGKFEMTQYSMTLPNWGRYSAYVYYSQTTLGQQRVADLNTLLAVELRKFGRIDMHYQSQAGSNQRFGGNWYLKFGKQEDSYLRLGMDSVHLRTGSSGLLPAVGVRIPIPKHQVLEVSYLRDVSTQMLQVQFGGKIVRPREIRRDSHGVARVAAHAIITGLVYIDVNYNGEFDAGDRAIPDVRVWRDGEAMTLTDARGYYRFDNVDSGAHTIRAELAGVPAGFVFAGSSERTLAVMPNHENRLDFRVIKTGQIAGKVTYMDYSLDSEHPIESGFPDAHLLATGDRDTYSEGNGSFLLGDLPPGQYEIHLDPATVPKGYVSQPPSYVVRVTPGAISKEPRFRLAIPPKPVIQIREPDQIIRTPESSTPEKQRLQQLDNKR
jgi:hypothetical protein